MVMDFLRSCYSQRIRFVEHDPTKTALATWYFCKPGALVFPGDQAFGSPTWDSDHPTATSIGFDALAPRTYYNGKRLNRSSGQSFAGPKEWFLHGQPTVQNLPRGSDLTPRVCIPSPTGLATGGQVVDGVRAEGGILTGGVCSDGMLPGVPCANCPTTTPLTVSVTLGGFSGAHSWYNGTHQLTQTISPCIWALAGPGTLALQLFRNPSNTWDLFLTGSIGSYYSGVVADCVSPGTLALVFSIIGGNPTCTISVP
jgi:hypothetical protein